jgi:Uma2 family endonuclease
MAIQKIRMSDAEFDDFIQQPENAGRLFELMNGEVREVSPGRTANSELGHIIAFSVRLFCQQRGLPCHTSGGDGAYKVLENILAPDFAYKPTPMSDDYPDPVPPLWVVEIISPTDKATDIREKREIYLKAGILLWEMYPQLKSVDVYAPGQPPQTFRLGDTLEGGTVLPEFSLAVSDIFPS